jgi:transforming growth factor-beta-induced protein
MKIVLALSLVVTAACGDDDAMPRSDAGSPGADGGRDSGGGGNTIADIAAGNPDFSLLVAAASRAGLVDVLRGAGPFTVFAPNNDAFAASGIGMSDIESMPVAELTTVLRYHVIAGAAVESSAVVAGPASSAATAEGGWALSLILGTSGGVTLNGGNAVTGGANVVTADIAADNGVIHVIDRVLLPPDVPALATYAGLSDLVEAVTAAGLADDLQGAGPFTVFAPTNDAFPDGADRPTGDALATVLLYHVVAAGVPSADVPARADTLATNEAGNNLTLLFDTSSGVAVNGIAVAAADVGATNGVVHVIGGVLLPPSVLDMAGIAGLTQLAGAIGRADMAPGVDIAETLDAPAPGAVTGFTVFAPSNAAFEAIASTVAGLSNAQVAEVLQFHVLDPATFSDPVLAAGLPAAPGGDVPTLLGEDASIDTSMTPPRIEGASIVATDIHVTNGVIHLIDAVMIPTSL